MAYLDKALHFGLLAVAFTLPFIRLNHVTEYVFLSVLILWLGMKLFADSFAIARTSLDLPILLFLGWVLLTIPFASDWWYSLGEWRKTIPRFLMFWFVVNVVKNEQEVSKILHAFSLGLFIVVSMETAFFFVQGGHPLSMTLRAGDYFGSSQWLSCFLVMGIPVLWLGMIGEKRGWRRHFYVSALMVSGVALFLVHTRAAWVAVMTQGLFYGVWRFTKSWTVAGLAVFLAVGLLFMFVAIPGVHHELVTGSKFTSPRTLLLRFNTWDLALQDIREHPLTGIGYGKNSFKLNHPNLDDRFHNAVHNSFLSNTVQIGIPGFLLIAWIFWVVLNKTSEWNQRFSGQYLGNLSLVIFLITIGLMVRVLFDDLLIGTVVYLFMLLLGLCFKLGVNIEGTQPRKSWVAQSGAQ